MPRLNAAEANSNGDLPALGKSELDVTGSASNSDSEVYNSGIKTQGKDGLTFVSEGLAKKHYSPVETYEGIHRYDPDFEWEPAEEKRVVRKVHTTTL